MSFDQNQLAALASVLRLGSFEAAAQELSVTPSAISQRIKALEERAGGALVHRTTPCRGTKSGRRLAKLADDLNLLQGQAAEELALGPKQSSGATVIRVAVNADSLATWFIDAMAAVPEFLFDIVIDDQDHSADWLRRGEVSAAVTAHGTPVTGCDAHRLGSMQYTATASPGYVAQWLPEGCNTEALAQAPCITFNQKDALQRRWLDKAAGSHVTPPSHFLPSTQAFADAAKAGLGWGMNPVNLIQEELKNGDLVELKADSRLEVALEWQVSRIMAPALAKLTRAVLGCGRKHLSSHQ